MKTICFLLFAITMDFLVSQAQGEEWVSKYTDKDGSRIFYNRESVLELPNGIVRGWFKVEFSDKGKESHIRFATREEDYQRYETLSQALVLFEFNCPKREKQLVAVIEL
jgi:hypothetical protein